MPAERPVFVGVLGVGGRVQPGQPAGVPEKVMHDWYESAPPDAANIPTMFINNITQVVLGDLKPLYDAIKPIASGRLGH